MSCDVLIPVHVHLCSGCVKAHRDLLLSSPKMAETINLAPLVGQALAAVSWYGNSDLLAKGLPVLSVVWSLRF
jgi:hypothetical protein